jgi:CheY-like chemotaxis protein
MTFHGLQVLVVEDEPLIGLDLSDMLKNVGCYIIGPFRRAVVAVEHLNSNRPDVAILDLKLADGDSVAVADALAAKDIPFCWVTGQSAAEMPERHTARPIVSKPFTPESLFSGLAFSTVMRGVATAMPTGGERST